MRTRSKSAGSPKNSRSLRSQSQSLNHETKKIKQQRRRARSSQLQTNVRKVQEALRPHSESDCHCQNVFSDQENHSNTRSHEADDDDDDTDSVGDDLPAVEFDSSTAKSKVKELVPGTMVWAKSRGWPHWPAVLIKVCTNNTKAWVNYMDEENQRVQVGVRSMAPFFGLKRARFIEIGKASPFSKYFLQSLENAEDYLIKQGLGKTMDSPCKISSTSGSWKNIPPVSSYQMPISPNPSHDGSPDISHDESPDTKPSPPEPNAQNCNLSSDEELRIGYPIGHSKCDVDNDEEIKEKKKVWQHVAARLLKYIHRNTTKKHLLAIYNGKTKSERHRLFSSRRARDKEKLRLMAGLGPVADDDLQSELTSFLGDLYVEHCMECKDDIPSTSYITEVWLPEAIIFAIQRTRRIGRKNAEKLFHSECVQSLLDLGEDMPDVSSSVMEDYEACDEW